MGSTDDSVNTAHLAIGQIHVIGETPELTPWQLGACVTVADASSDLDGTRLYVPGVPMDYSGVNDRLGIWLLDDPALSATDAALQALDSLTLAATPLTTLTAVIESEA